jgi:hypothetical protein
MRLALAEGLSPTAREDLQTLTLAKTLAQNRKPMAQLASVGDASD